MLTLYDYTKAPSPRRARIFLAEKGIDVANVQIDLRSGGQFDEAYKAINPRCTVPALKLETGQIVTENLAIADYLNSLKADPPLIGVDAASRADVLQWNSRIEFDGLMAVAEMLRNTSKGMIDRALPGQLKLSQIPELAARGQVRLADFFKRMDDHLESRDFVSGDNYSLADITLLVCVDFSAWVKATPDARLTHLHRWHSMASARPASKA
ncbi:MAG: glutathione S-transferase family protein [Maricaulaceae bacterium]